ncbi:MAG: class I SAM-dependent methyltransferase [Nanoarchaeota archaeon]
MKPSEWDKYADPDKYVDAIFTPFALKGAKALLETTIKKLKGERVIDIGCGYGNLLPFLSKTFKEVIAVDFSPKMVEKAKHQASILKNVEVMHGDVRKLEHDGFDVAVSVNSVLMPNVLAVNEALASIYDCLKPKGVFIGIFPSMDSELYLSMILFENELIKGRPAKKARKNAGELIGETDYDFLTSMLDANGRQKFFYGFELSYRLKQAGFRTVSVKKMPIPWKALKNSGIYFPDKPKPWDWLVVAKKS